MSMHTGDPPKNNHPFNGTFPGEGFVKGALSGLLALRGNVGTESLVTQSESQKGLTNIA